MTKPGVAYLTTTLLWILALARCIPPTMAVSQHVQAGVSQIQEYFDKEGYLILRNFFKKETLDPWRNTIGSDAFFNGIFETLYRNGHTPFPEASRLKTNGNEVKRQYAMEEGRQRGYREIVMRSPGRYEISLLHEVITLGSQLNTTKHTDPLLEQLSTIISALLRLDEQGLQMSNANVALSLVISTPDAAIQDVHGDGDHVDMQTHQPCHSIAVFIPLCNVTQEMGPTEIFPGTHYITRQPSPMKIELSQLSQSVSPPMQYGDVVLWDYRTLHRGLPNLSQKNRPMLVLVISQPWFIDDKNWPTRSMSEPRTKTLPKIYI